MKKSKRKPSPKGTLVTGFSKKATIWFRSNCRGHVWETTTVPEPAEWANGQYMQSARCLVCGGPPTLPVDSDWWMEHASQDYVLRAMFLIRKQRRQMLDNYQYLKDRANV